MQHAQPVSSQTNQFSDKHESPPIAVGEADAAKAIGMSVFFLRKDRRTKRLLPFFRVGDRILYSLDRVRAALLELEEGGSAIKDAKHIRGGAR